jgi:transcriptional regulator with XRE-family HTH domain
MPDFAIALRSLRDSHGLSIRELAKKIHFSPAMVGHVESGVRSPSAAFAAAADRELKAGGMLAELHRAEAAGDDDVYRRTLIAGLAGLADTAVLSPNLVVESARTAIVGALGGRAVIDDWVDIADDYGRAYMRLSPLEIQRRLAQDLLTLRRAFDTNESPQLQRVVARLSLLQGMATASTGDTITSLRWYRTAARVATATGDNKLVAWVRGRTSFRRGYDVGDPAEVLMLAEHVPSVEARLAVAQAHAATGSQREALGALTDAYRAYEGADYQGPASIYDLAPWRMGIAAALVHARLGRPQATQMALERCDSERLPLRWQAQADLARSLAFAKSGDTAGGSKMARSVLDRLPPEQHSLTLRRLAEEVEACAMPR